MPMGRLSKATNGSSRRREVTFTNSRLMINVFEVVLKDSFLAKTNSRERLTKKERRRIRARRVISRNIFSLLSKFSFSPTTVLFIRICILIECPRYVEVTFAFQSRIIVV